MLPLTNEELDLLRHGSSAPTSWTPTSRPTSRAPSDLWRARWEAEYGDDIDGIFTVDPVTVSYLLECHRAGHGQGTRSSPRSTSSPVVENLVYLNIPDPIGQDVFLNAVAQDGLRHLRQRSRRPGAGDPGVVPRRGRGPGADPLVRPRMSRPWSTGTEIAGETAGRGATDPARRRLPQRRHRLEDVVLPRLLRPGRRASCADDQQNLTARLRGHVGDPAERRRPARDGHRLHRRLRGLRPGAGSQFVVADIFAPAGGVIRTSTSTGSCCRIRRSTTTPVATWSRSACRSTPRADPHRHLEHDHRPRPDGTDRGLGHPGRPAGERVERRAQHLLTSRDVDRRTGL